MEALYVSLLHYEVNCLLTIVDIVYCGWILVEIIIIYFFAVETAGKTLEELSSIFEAKNPRKESTRKAKIEVDSAGNVVNFDEEHTA